MKPLLISESSACPLLYSTEMKSKKVNPTRILRVICDSFHLKLKKRVLDHSITDRGEVSENVQPRNKVPGALEISRLPVRQSR